MTSLLRCPWPGTDPLYLRYHDEEWGVPVRDDVALFQHLLLDGAQAGLSWITILRKREGYLRAFHGLDPVVMAGYDDADIGRLLADTGIVRNRLKVQAFVTNARAFLEVRERESFATLLWTFTGGETLQNVWRSSADVPTETAESRAMSAELKRRRFRFVGPPSATRSCRRWEWSMTTSSNATAMPLWAVPPVLDRWSGRA